jgi:hypothetical protein
MRVSIDETHCPKCDNNLRSQTDGSTLTVDIAHHGEHVSDALRKLDAAIAEGRQGVAAKLRIIVGGGLIRDAVIVELGTHKHRGDIRRYEIERGNPGSVLVHLV